MPPIVVLAVLALILGITTPAEARDPSTSYNYKSAPKGQTMDASDEEKAEAMEEASREEEEEDLTSQQKADRERRKITGEGSNVYHGDEHKWPNMGRVR